MKVPLLTSFETEMLCSRQKDDGELDFVALSHEKAEILEPCVHVILGGSVVHVYFIVIW